MLTATIGVLSVIVAAVAAYISWAAARRAENAAAVQTHLATHAAAAEWLRDLRNWADEAIDILARASYCCGHEDEDGIAYDEELRCARRELSALIDRGRFFLPNIPEPGMGESKPRAYRGWRHATLDPLVAAERILSGHEGSGKFEDREAALIAMRREFVSAIQEILAPEHHNAEIARLIRDANKARAADKTLGGLIPDGATVPTGADRLLHG